MSNLDIQVQPHLACFEILKHDWNQEKGQGYIEVDFGEGKIVGFHCHAKKLEFALQHIQAFGERCQELDTPAFQERMCSLYHHRLFCDLHKGKNQENELIFYRIDRVGKGLECMGGHFQVDTLYKSCIEEEVQQYLQELAEMHQSEVRASF